MVFEITVIGSLNLTEQQVRTIYKTSVLIHSPEESGSFEIFDQTWYCTKTQK